MWRERRTPTESRDLIVGGNTHLPTALDVAELRDNMKLLGVNARYFTKQGQVEESQ